MTLPPTSGCPLSPGEPDEATWTEIRQGPAAAPHAALPLLPTPPLPTSRPFQCP